MAFTDVEVKVDNSSFTIHSPSYQAVQEPVTAAERQVTIVPVLFRDIAQAAFSAIRWAAPEAPRITGPLFTGIDGALLVPSANFKGILDTARQQGGENYFLARWGGRVLEAVAQARRLFVTDPVSPPLLSNAAWLPFNRNLNVDLAAGVEGNRVTELGAQNVHTPSEEHILRLAAHAERRDARWAAIYLHRLGADEIHVSASHGFGDGEFSHAGPPHDTLGSLANFAIAIRHALDDRPASA